MVMLFLLCPGGDKDVCSGLLHAAAEAPARGFQVTSQPSALPALQVDRKLAGRWGLDEL